MKKKLISVLLCGVMAVSLAACSGGGQESGNTGANGKEAEASGEEAGVNGERAGANGELEKITFALDWAPNTNHTGLYVAENKGYFEEAGFDVEFVQANSGNGSELVGVGQAEFGVDFQDSLANTFASDNPVPVTAVAAIIQHNTSGIITLAENNIQSPKDLEGFHYATWESDVEQALMRYVVEADGGNFDNVILDPVTVDDAVAGLQSNVDAVWIYYAWDGIRAELSDTDTNFFFFKDYCQDMDEYSPVVIANNDYLEANPERAKAFLGAVKKGYEYAMENPEDAAAILCEEVPELDKELILESQKWLADQYQADAPYWGYIDAKRWDACYRWLYEQKLIPKEIPSGYGCSNDYLSE
ncbi:MAG: ABC transporter substrate-binding protein [Eubacterium sp.]|nr:ABC transporter substrate-binding protein [Eubacterium sp.]